jgi:hypothetical protein
MVKFKRAAMSVQQYGYHADESKTKKHRKPMFPVFLVAEGGILKSNPLFSLINPLISTAFKMLFFCVKVFSSNPKTTHLMAQLN